MSRRTIGIRGDGRRRGGPRRSRADRPDGRGGHPGAEEHHRVHRRRHGARAGPARPRREGLGRCSSTASRGAPPDAEHGLARRRHRLGGGRDRARVRVRDPQRLAVDGAAAARDTVPDGARARRAAGKATGLFSTGDLPDATPGAFAAHVSDRGEDEDVAAQMHAHHIEFLLGGRGGGAVAPLEGQPGVTYVKNLQGAAVLRRRDGHRPGLRADGIADARVRDRPRGGGRRRQAPDDRPGHRRPRSTSWPTTRRASS